MRTILINNRSVYPDESGIDLTIPNQAPALSYLIGQMMKGNPIGITEMRYDNEPTLDDPDVRNLDSKHISSAELDLLLKNIDSQTPTATVEIPEIPEAE